jgi:hypothetical protein
MRRATVQPAELVDLYAVAFGGRLLSFGTPARVASAPNVRPPPVSPPVGTGRDP